MSSPTRNTDEMSDAVEPPSAAQLELADPAERPRSHIVIFDGDCRFCQKQVQRLNRFDGGNRLSFISLHDDRIAEWYPELSHKDLMEQMYVVSADGTRHPGAQAVRFLSRKLPGLWWLAPMMHIPFCMPIWQWMYRLVAQRRYRLSKDNSDGGCDNGACEIHFKK